MYVYDFHIKRSSNISPEVLKSVSFQMDGSYILLEYFLLGPIEVEIWLSKSMGLVQGKMGKFSCKNA